MTLPRRVVFPAPDGAEMTNKIPWPFSMLRNPDTGKILKILALQGGASREGSFPLYCAPFEGARAGQHYKFKRRSRESASEAPRLQGGELHSIF
jgi:hypothetical protein